MATGDVVDLMDRRAQSTQYIEELRPAAGTSIVIRNMNLGADSNGQSYALLYGKTASGDMLHDRIDDRGTYLALLDVSGNLNAEKEARAHFNNDYWLEYRAYQNNSQTEDFAVAVSGLVLND